MPYAYDDETSPQKKPSPFDPIQDDDPDKSGGTGG